MENKKGFLLLEVIMSLVIVTAGLLYVGRVYSTVSDVIGRSRTLFISALLLEEKLFDFQVKGKAEPGTADGEFDGHKGYRWHSAAGPASRENPDLFRITIDVSDDKSIGESDKYNLETYIKYEEAA